MMLRVALCVAIAIAFCSARAEEPPQAFAVDGSIKYGRPKRVVPPTYPPEALEKHITGYVDVTGRVAPLFSLEDAQFAPGTPEAAVFVEPLKAVIGRWEFYQQFSNDCFPSSEPVRFRVVFEIENAAPKINIEVATASKQQASPLHVTHRVSPAYPEEQRQHGLQAYVYTRSEINPDGSVASVATDVYPPMGPLDAGHFANAARRALSNWTFNPLPEGQTGRRAACYHVFFQLKD